MYVDNTSMMAPAYMSEQVFKLLDALNCISLSNTFLLAGDGNF
jgi:hypothetical protein